MHREIIDKIRDLKDNITSVYYKNGQFEHLSVLDMARMSRHINKIAIQMGILRNMIGECATYTEISDEIARYGYEFLNLVIPTQIQKFHYPINFPDRTNARIDRFETNASSQADINILWNAFIEFEIFAISDSAKQEYNSVREYITHRIQQANFTVPKITSTIKIPTEKEYFDSCVTPQDFDMYLEYFPNGRYRDIANPAKKRFATEREINSLRTISECIDYKNSYWLDIRLVELLDLRAYSFCNEESRIQAYLNNFCLKRDDANKNLQKLKNRDSIYIIISVAIGIIMIVIYFCAALYYL